MIYRIATMPYIGRDAKALYKHEDAAANLVESIARDLAPYVEHVIGRDINIDGDFYSVLVPEALASMLNLFDHSSALAACLGYLRKEFGAEIQLINGRVKIDIKSDGNPSAQAVGL